MIRHVALGLLAGLLLGGCKPEKSECSAPHPDFDLVLKLAHRPLPPDTVVHVTFGGSGMEEYRLAAPGSNHEVVFCDPADENGVALEASTRSNGTGEAGASGDAGAAGAGGGDAGIGVASLHCGLYTGGFAKIEVTASGLDTMTYDLLPLDHVCTVSQTIVLDSPDGG